MNDHLRRRWRTLVETLGIAGGLADGAFEAIEQNYSEPGRVYHTLDHIGNVLDAVERLAGHSQNLGALKLAAWLHDVVYDSRASDNEERSATYAERLCQRLAIPDGPVVASLILATKKHEPGGAADAQILIDADLAVLGAGEAEYQTYAAQIREEYAWVPEPEFWAGRRAVLERFLLKPRIFQYLTDLEAPARRNIAAEIERLERCEL